MKNSEKDKYDHKLYRFLKEIESIPFSVDDNYTHARQEIMRRYGFDENDLHRAWRISQSTPERKWFFDGIGLKKSVQLAKAKSEKRAERNGIRAQYSDEELEAQLKAEDDWIMDVYDEPYDEEDMHK